MPSGDFVDDARLATQRGQIGAHALHSQYDSRELTAPGRAAFQARFEQQVDPDGVLPPEERQRRAEHARTLYYRQLAYRSAKARRQRKSSAPSATSKKVGGSDA